MANKALVGVLEKYYGKRVRIVKGFKSRNVEIFD